METRLCKAYAEDTGNITDPISGEILTRMTRERVRLLTGASVVITSFFFFYQIYVFWSLRPSDSMEQIPGGYFIMGSNDTGDDLDGLEGTSKARAFTANEKPKQKVFLDSFYIDKYEVTNLEYRKFIKETGVQPPAYWENSNYETGREKHPVHDISWLEADSYCRWRGKRLPSEQEWEKSARGPAGNIYTWGNTFSITKGNFNRGDTVPVGSIKTDKSYYGVFDLAGNLLEWTSSWYKPYNGAKDNFNEYGEVFKVIRGATGISSAHYNLPGVFTRSSNRLFFPPEKSSDTIGFRCAKDSN